jgi:hypothetical protein
MSPAIARSTSTLLRLFQADSFSRGFLQQALERVSEFLHRPLPVELDVRASAQERHDLLRVAGNFRAVRGGLAVRVIRTPGGSIEEYVQRGVQQDCVFGPQAATERAAWPAICAAIFASRT